MSINFHQLFFLLGEISILVSIRPLLEEGRERKGNILIDEMKNEALLIDLNEVNDGIIWVVFQILEFIFLFCKILCASGIE